MKRKEMEGFLETTVRYLQNQEQFMALAVGGSYLTDTMDAYSDLDLVIVVRPDAYQQVMEQRKHLAGELGHLLASFTGEHVGEPRLLICLYADPLLHVDLKFVSLDDAAHRVEDFAILWERERALSLAFASEAANYPPLDLQWVEDRFWIWVHYGAGKIGRGELFETVEFLSFLRLQVLGPLILQSKGLHPRGVRYIERDAPEYIAPLEATIARHDRDSCCRCLSSCIDLYRKLRDECMAQNLVLHTEAERAALAYFEEIMQKGRPFPQED